MPPGRRTPGRRTGGRRTGGRRTGGGARRPSRRRRRYSPQVARCRRSPGLPTPCGRRAGTGPVMIGRPAPRLCHRQAADPSRAPAVRPPGTTAAISTAGGTTSTRRTSGRLTCPEPTMTIGCSPRGRACSSCSRPRRTPESQTRCSPTRPCATTRLRWTLHHLGRRLVPARPSDPVLFAFSGTAPTAHPPRPEPDPRAVEALDRHALRWARATARPARRAGRGQRCRPARAGDPDRRTARGAERLAGLGRGAPVPGRRRRRGAPCRAGRRPGLGAVAGDRGDVPL